MLELTPAERRGVAVVVFLLGLGAARDLWNGIRPHPVEPGESAAVALNRARRSADTTETTVERPSMAGEITRSRPGRLQSARLDLNHATERDLDALPGIGPVLARRIVEHRDRHGPFQRVEDLLAIRGIGSRLFERLRAEVSAGPRDSASSRVSGGSPR